MSFASDARVIFAGPLGSDVVYKPAGGVDVALRVIRRRPDEEIGFGDARFRVPTGVFLIQLSDLPQGPVAGDKIECEGVTYICQGTPERDERHLRWRVEAHPT